jgi:hypothetical protein
MVAGFHNNGNKWTSTEQTTLIELYKMVEKLDNGNINWNLIRFLFNTALPGPDRTEASLECQFSRILAGAKSKYCPGGGAERCRKIGCNLLKQGHLCLNDDGVSLSERLAKRLSAEANAFLDRDLDAKLTAMGKEYLTNAQANDFFVAERQLRGHTFDLDKLDSGIDSDVCGECVEIPYQSFPPAPGDDQMIDSFCDWSSELVEQ